MAIETGFPCTPTICIKDSDGGGDGRLFDVLPWGWALITAWALFRENTVFNLPYRTVCKCNFIIITNQPIRVNISSALRDGPLENLSGGGGAKCKKKYNRAREN